MNLTQIDETWDLRDLSGNSSLACIMIFPNSQPRRIHVGSCFMLACKHNALHVGFYGTIIVYATMTPFLSSPKNYI